MNKQAPDQAQQELRAIICGIFEHVHRKEKENAILSARRMEATGQSQMNDTMSQKYDDNERRYSKREMAGDPWKG